MEPKGPLYCMHDCLLFRFLRAQNYFLDWCIVHNIIVRRKTHFPLFQIMLDGIFYSFTDNRIEMHRNVK